jgi:hypothetical protein
MSRWLTILGLTLTVVYLAFLCFIFNGPVVQILLLKPNEIGDVLAGSFGPLAILWLILGFFQQGIELRQNTKALELQAEELKNSVEQQRELVDVSRKQVEAELAAVRYEQDSQRKAALPKFVIHGVKQSIVAMKVIPGYYYFELENVGNVATAVEVYGSENLEIGGDKNFASYPRNEKKKIKFNARNGRIESLRSWVQIDYIDAMGLPGKVRFDLNETDSGVIFSAKANPMIN